MISGISQGIDSNGEDVVGDGDWDQLIEQAKAGNDLALLEIVKQFEVYLLMGRENANWKFSSGKVRCF